MQTILQQNIKHNFSYLKNMRLKNQLLVIISFQIIFIMTFLVCSNYIHTTFIQLFFTESSQKIYLKTSNSMLRTQLNEYNSYFTSLFHTAYDELILVQFHITKILKSQKSLKYKYHYSKRTSNFYSLNCTNGQTLISFFQLYTYLRNKTQTHLDNLNPKFNMNYGGVNSKIPKSIQSTKMAIYNTTLSCLCYTNKTKFNQPNTHEEMINIKTQESMQSFGMIIFQGKTTLYNIIQIIHYNHSSMAMSKEIIFQ